MPTWMQQALLWLLRRLLSSLVRKSEPSSELATPVQEQEDQDPYAEMDLCPNWVTVCYQEISAIAPTSWLISIETAQHVAGVFRMKGANAQLTDMSSERCKAGLHILKWFHVDAPGIIHISWVEASSEGIKERIVATVTFTKTEECVLTKYLKECLESQMDVHPLKKLEG